MVGSLLPDGKWLASAFPHTRVELVSHQLSKSIVYPSELGARFLPAKKLSHALADATHVLGWGGFNETPSALINWYIWYMSHAVLDLSGVGGLTPPLVPLNPPKLTLNPTDLVKKSQKYIADPPLVLPQIDYWSHVMKVVSDTVPMYGFQLMNFRFIAHHTISHCNKTTTSKETPVFTALDSSCIGVSTDPTRRQLTFSRVDSSTGVEMHNVSSSTSIARMMPGINKSSNWNNLRK